jgi:hypothetical protein
MKLKSNETNISGKWIEKDGMVVADAACKRIEWLVDNDLRQIAFSPQWGAWETLFKDLSDGRFWERTYPNSQMHGGGPPTLKVIKEKEAMQKYEFTANDLMFP